MTEQSTNTKAALYRKIAAVAGAIGAVEKDGRNADQKYRYPTPASVMSAVKPLMAEQGLAIVPHLVDFQEIDTGQRAGSGKPFMLNRVSMHYHLLDGETGEELVVPWQAQAGTYGDDKGLAKAQTIALRTFLIQLFQIPAEDPETDPDARDARPPQSQQRPAPQRPTQQSASYEPPPPPANGNGQKRQRTAEELLARIQELTEQAVSLDLEIELSKPLDQMTREELIQHGGNLKAAIDQASVPGRVPSEPLPAAKAA